MPERVFVFRPDWRSPKTWLIATGVVVLGAGLAALFFTLFLVAAALSVVALPLLWWWKRKALRARPDGHPRIIDVEYEITKRRE